MLYQFHAHETFEVAAMSQDINSRGDRAETENQHNDIRYYLNYACKSSSNL
ncbi:MAG: hypothetical protein QNJ53_17020 [Pleurocapsa sp. MO_192.B19]|nr:hypothetical protein [Pleurocapsa sp. MO_192.B19]